MMPSSVSELPMRASKPPTSAGPRFTTSPSALVFGLGLGAVLCAFLVPALTRPLQDPDMWWLTWAGRAGLPGRNLLSFTSPERRWICHEPAVAWAWGRWGWAGVAAGRALVLTALGAALLGIARRHSAWAALLALLITLPALSITFSERAMGWGLLTLALTQLSLRRPGPLGAALATALVVAGSLLHGSWLLSAAVLLLARPAWGLLALAIALALPGGAERGMLLWQYLLAQGGAGVAQSYVAEWRPVWDSPLPAHWIRAALAWLGVAIAWPAATRRERLLLGALLLMSALQLRHLAPLACLLLPVLVRSLDRHLPPRAHRGSSWSLALLACLALLSRPLPDPTLYPEDLLQQIPEGARVYSDLELGAWIGQSGRPVFWDARNDAYSAEVMEQGITVAAGGPAATQILARYQVHSVLSTNEVMLASLQSQGWRAVDSRGDLALLRLPAPQGGATVPASGE